MDTDLIAADLDDAATALKNVAEDPNYTLDRNREERRAQARRVRAYADAMASIPDDVDKIQVSLQVHVNPTSLDEVKALLERDEPLTLTPGGDDGPSEGD